MKKREISSDIKMFPVLEEMFFFLLLILMFNSQESVESTFCLSFSRSLCLYLSSSWTSLKMPATISSPSVLARASVKTVSFFGFYFKYFPFNL